MYDVFVNLWVIPSDKFSSATLFCDRKEKKGWQEQNLINTNSDFTTNVT